MRDWDSPFNSTNFQFLMWITLPMRDWDFFTALYNKVTTSFSDYITYERLRHIEPLNKFICFLIWITLPMRDWDQQLRKDMVDHNVNGLHYLWEIETLHIPDSIIICIFEYIRDYITYERLRHSSKLIYLLFWWFLDYITYERLRHYYFIALHENDDGLHYLWEIETVQDHRFQIFCL